MREGLALAGKDPLPGLMFIVWALTSRLRRDGPCIVQAAVASDEKGRAFWSHGKRRGEAQNSRE